MMTGDGAGYDDGVGFHADMERMQAAGWGVEVISWNGHCRHALREWATTNGAFIRLDDYYGSVTFLEGVRRAKPLDMSQRPKAVPRVGTVRQAELAAKKESEAELAALRQKVEAMEAKAVRKAKGKANYEKRMGRGRPTA